MTKLYKDTNNVINLIKNDIQTVVSKYTDTVEYNLIDKCLSIKSTNGRIILERCDITTLYKEDGITTWESDLITLFSFFPNAPFITLTSFNLTDTYTDYEITGALALQTFLKTYAITTFEYQSNVINYSALLALDTTNFKYGYIYSVDDYTIDEIPKTNVMFVWSKSGWICFGNDLITIATNISAGLMSAADKTKLDSLDVNIATDTDFQTGTNNSKRTTVLGIFNAIKYWLNNSVIDTLTTVSKTITGAINELKSTKANSGINSDITSLTGLTNPYIDTSSTQQTKLGGLALANGFVTYGKASSFPTGIGYYLTGYVDATYGVRLLSYNGVSYGQLNLGARIGTTGSVFSIQMNADGTLTINGTTTSYGLHNIGNLQQDFGSDATGDMIYRLASGLLGRLPIGTTDQIISVVNGLPTYDSRIATASKIGFVKPDTTTISIDSNGVISSPILSTSYNKSIYVSSNGTSTGTGSISNPYNRIYKAINYVIGTGTRSNPQYQNLIIDIDGDFTITDPTLSEVDFTLYNIKYNIHGKITYSPTDATTDNERYLFNLSSASNSYIYVYGEGTIAPTGTYCSFAKVYGYINCTHYILCNITVINSVLPNILKVYGLVNNTNENFITGNNTLSNNQASGLLICENLYNYNDYLGLTIPPTTILTNGASNTSSGYTLTNKYPTTTTINESNRRFAFYLSACNQVFINNPKIFISGNNSFICHDSNYGGALNISGCLVSGYKILTNTSFFRCMRGIYNGSIYIDKYQGAWIHDVVMQSGYSSSSVSDLFGNSIDIIKIESSVTSILNFVVHNCIFQNTLNATTLSWIGKQYLGDKVPSINMLGSNMYINNIPTSALPDNSYVITIDSNGKSQKVLSTEIKTPTVVTSDVKYSTQTTIANYIANDSQASSTAKSNLVSLVDGSLYVLTDSTPLVESAYKQVTTIVSWGSVTNKPSFATVATTADYTDLINKPDLSIYALISDQNGGITTVLTANTDILALIRTYLTNLNITDTTTLIQRTLSFVANGYTMTFDTNTFITDINFILSCKLINSSASGIGYMQLLNSSNLIDTSYEVSILQTSYKLERLAKYSEISPITECYNTMTSTICSTNEVSIPLVGNIYRNWTTNTIIPISGYLTINGSITWQYGGGTGALVTFNLYVNDVKITLATDIGGSTTGKNKTTNLNGYCQVTAGDTITLKGITSNNNITTQASSHILFKIT